MSVSVLLVDDEKLERVLIRKGFDWEGHGFNIIGEASSGKEALQFVEHQKPDIVLTDISMPQMDGLELAEKIRAIHPQCRIIIVTGYREFEYARRAVKIGIQDFLLKPVNVQEIESIVNNLKESIEQERANVEKNQMIKENILANQDVLMECFFQRLVENRIEEEEGKRKIKIYGCNFLEDNCICANIQIVSNQNEDFLTEQHQKTIELIKEKEWRKSVCFVHYMHNIILFFSNVDVDDVKKRCQELLSDMNKEDIYALIGISQHQEDFIGIANAYEDTKKALSASVFLGKNLVVTYAQYEELMKQGEEIKEFDWKEFDLLMTNGMDQKVNDYIHEYMNNIKNQKETDLEYIRLLSIGLLNKAGNTLNKYGLSLVNLFSLDEIYVALWDKHTLDEIETYTKETVQVIVDYHKSKQGKQKNKVVMETLEYIGKNLFDPELSLKKVAAQIFTNESYLSRVFKKEMNESLIEYITKCRIEESIKLLRTTDLKVYEIAEKIGFRDSHYFSICFKKQMGVTIKEFKGQSF